MYLVSNNKAECTGCRACVEVCPQKCITMQGDKEGFLYPVIDTESCVSCGLCKDVCPTTKKMHAETAKIAFAGVHRSENICFSTSSGGAFAALCQILIPEGYIVYGVKWTDDFQVVHDVAYTVEECCAFSKSKYVLSNTNDCFSSVENNLKSGKKVLFSGTPCQCAALYSYLAAKHIKTDELMVVDIICHGAPSQKTFDKYIAEIGLLDSYEFRNKRPINGVVNSRSAHLVFRDGTSRTVKQATDPFLRAYYGRLFYRPSCGACQYASINRVSDITLGDAWGIEQIYPEWKSSEGVSLVLLNSEKSKIILKKLQQLMELREVDIKWAENTNEQLRVPTSFHTRRKVFFDNIDKTSFSTAVSKAMSIPLHQRILRKVERIFTGKT